MEVRLPSKYFGQQFDKDILQYSNNWGCLGYVLDPTIQDNKKLPQWESKARQSQFLGQSERHTATDRIIRNIQTEIITYQFHMVHDDHFMTIEIANEVNCVRLPDNWMDL